MAVSVGEAVIMMGRSSLHTTHTYMQTCYLYAICLLLAGLPVFATSSATSAHGDVFSVDQLA